MGETMKVWIDQDLCTGDGLCEEIAPAVFFLDSDGLAYVQDGANTGMVDGSPKFQGTDGRADVPEALEDSTIEAAEECPGECIFIEARS